MREHQDIVFAPSQAAWLWRSRAGSPYLRTVLWSLIERKLQGSKQKPADAGRPLAPDERLRIERIAAIYGQNLLAMHDLCRRAGSRLVLLTFLHDDKRLAAYWSAALVALNERMRAVAAAENITLIDLARDLEAAADRQEFFFADHYHPAWRGAAFIADRVASALAPLLANGR